MLTTLPKEGLRAAIYSGDIYRFGATKWSTRLQNFVKNATKEHLGKNYRRTHETLSAQAFFERIGGLRSLIYEAQYSKTCIEHIITSLGEEAIQFAYEPPKLRAVSHEGHRNPKAAPVYYGHRDTWYATPQSTINIWIPLDDLCEEETFAFYPSFFDQALLNNSNLFNFDNNALGAGWSSSSEGIENLFPTCSTLPNAHHEKTFSISENEILVFSGSHFHRTKKQSLGTTRFSLDFRIVHLQDHAQNRGAPNVDNASQGCCLSSYRQPVSRAH